MRELKENGVAVFIVTHRIAELVRISDKATVMRDGKDVGVLEKKDLKFLFPSGSQAEFDRASEICSVSQKAFALEILSLNEVAFLIDNSEFAICSDTGLAHLSAVVDTPSLTLYGPTDVGLIGTYGNNQNHFVSPNSDINKISVNDILTRMEELNFI